MKEKITEREPASAFRRFGAFFIDQAIILGIGTVLAALLLSSQGPAIERIVSEFGQIVTEASPETVETQLDAYVQSDDFNRDIETLQGPYAIWLGAGVIIAALYYIIPTAKKGQTIGKRVVGITVTDKAGEQISWAASAERYFLFVGLSSFSSLLVIIELAAYGTFTNLPNPLLQTLHSLLDLSIILAIVIGAVMIIARNDRRGYHDMSAGTRVVKK